MSKARELLEIGLGVVLNLQDKFKSSELDKEAKEKLALAILEDPSKSEDEKQIAMNWLDSNKTD